MSNVLKLGRKVLTIGTVFSTILWSIGIAALVPAMVQADTCPTFQSGDMIKVAGHPAIYSVDSNGKVLYFPSGDEFKSWNSNDSYGGYTTVSQSCYDALPVPNMAPLGVNFRPGSYVIKRPSSDQLYVVEPGNMIATITPDAAAALYGANYKVMTVADVFWPNYGSTRGAAITEAKVHPGMLVSNGGKNWYVNADGSLSEVTAAGFTANRFKQAFVHPVASTAIAGLSVGAQITAVVPALSDRTQTGGVVATVPGGTVSGGAVSVALASDNPAANILASGTAFNPVLKVVLTAGSSAVSVTGITIRKSGFAANSGVTGADIIDAQGVRHGNVASTLTSDNDLVLLFTGSPINVAANSSQTITVRVNLASTANSGTLQFSLVSPASVTTNGGSVSGNFPITGNVFTLQSGVNAVAGVTLNEQPVNASGATLNVDTNNEQDIAKFSIAETTSQENVLVKSLTVYNNGTAADTDVQDVQLVAQDGTVLATAQQSAKTVSFDLTANPYSIDKGTTKNFTIRAKIVNGAGRTIQFTVYNNYDAVLTGAQTGANVLPITTTGGSSGSGTSFPVGNQTNYNLVTIGSGTLSFNKDVTSPSSAVTPGANGVVLATFFAKPTGEDMELRQVQLTITTSSPVLTGSVTVKVNGASVWSGAPSVFAGAQTLTLSTYPVLTAGQNSYITIESNIMSGANAGTTILANLDITQVRRIITNDIIDPGVNAANGNTLSVQAGALSVTTLAAPVAQSLVAGSSGVSLAMFDLNAGAVSSGEDVKVSKIVVTDVTTTGALYSDIGNLVMYDSNGNALATTASTAANSASTTFTFAQPIVVSKTGDAVLTLKGDVLSGSSGTHRFLISKSSDVTATGVSTGNSITGAALVKGVGSGQQMTITGSGTLTLSSVTGGNAAPSNDQNVIVGSTAVPVFAVRLTAQNEPIKLTKFTLTATGTLNTVNDLLNLKLYRDNDTAPFAAAGQMASNGGTTSTQYTWTATDNLLPAAVQPGTPVTIYVKADVGPAGAAYLADNFRFQITSSSDIGAKGGSSGTTLSLSAISGVPAVNGNSYIAPFSVSVAADAPTGNQTQAIVAGTQLARVKITNNGSAKITVTGLKFTDSGSHTGTTTTYKLYYSDQNSSNYVGNTASSTMGSVDFSNLTSGGFTIDGGAYRYATVVINTLGSSVSGDTWQLSIASLGDVTYTAVGTDLGYAPNADSNLSSTTQPLFADGKPSLATLTKQ